MYKSKIWRVRTINTTKTSTQFNQSHHFIPSKNIQSLPFIQAHQQLSKLQSPPSFLIKSLLYRGLQQGYYDECTGWIYKMREYGMIFPPSLLTLILRNFDRFKDQELITSLWKIAINQKETIQVGGRKGSISKSKAQPIDQQRLCNSFLDIALKKKKQKLVLNLLETMKSRNLLSTKTFVILITSATTTRNMHQAIDLYKQYRKLGGIPTPELLVTMIHLHVRMNRIDRALELFQQLEKDPISYIPIKSTKSVYAFDIPNIEHISSYMDIEVLSMTNYVSYKGRDNQKRITVYRTQAPIVTAASHIIFGYCNFDMIEQAHRFLNKIHRYKLLPMFDAYAPMIHFYSKRHQWKQILLLLNQCQADKVTTNLDMNQDIYFAWLSQYYPKIVNESQSKPKIYYDAFQLVHSKKESFQMPDMEQVMFQYIQTMLPYSNSVAIHHAMMSLHCNLGIENDQHASIAELLYGMVETDHIFDILLVDMFTKRKELDKVTALESIRNSSNLNLF